MSDLEDKITEKNMKIREAKQQAAREEKIAKKAAKKEERRNSVSQAINSVKAPFIAIKEGIVNAYNTRVQQKAEEEDFKAGYEEYLRFAEKSEGKEGTIETENLPDGTTKTILYTDHGPLIKISTDNNVSGNNYTYQGFFVNKENMYEYRSLSIVDTPSYSHHIYDHYDRNHVITSKGFVLDPASGSYTRDVSHIENGNIYDSPSSFHTVGASSTMIPLETAHFTAR